MYLKRTLPKNDPRIKAQRNTVKIRSLLRQRPVQHLFVLIGRYLQFVVVFVFAIAVVTLFALLLPTYNLDDFSKVISLICGSFPPYDKTSSFGFDLFIFLLSKVVMWGMFITWAMEKFTSPVNPIHFAGAVTLSNNGKCRDSDSNNYKLVFRYWTMFKKRTFLYDVHLRAYIYKKSDAKKAEANPPIIFWEKHLDMVRGIRQWSCDFEEVAKRATELELSANNGSVNSLYSPKDILRFFYYYKEKYQADNCPYMLVFSIRGTDYSGKRIGKLKRYELRNVFWGTRFAYINGSDWDDEHKNIYIESFVNNHLEKDIDHNIEQYLSKIVDDTSKENTRTTLKAEVMQLISKNVKSHVNREGTRKEPPIKSKDELKATAAIIEKGLRNKEQPIIKRIMGIRRYQNFNKIVPTDPILYSPLAGTDPIALQTNLPSKSYTSTDTSTEDDVKYGDLWIIDPDLEQMPDIFSISLINRISKFHFERKKIKELVENKLTDNYY